ncbi:MAG: hypothetical protein GY696_40010 [Gammaproteobacteria bacterium]|nr:hypothetical protein [Gammaproteobacteria bacterium]
MSCAGHITATVQAFKLLEFYFHIRGRQLLRILVLVDTGNTVPGSAAITADLATKLGVKISPSRYHKLPQLRRVARWKWWERWPTLSWLPHPIIY